MTFLEPMWVVQNTIQYIINFRQNFLSVDAALTTINTVPNSDTIIRRLDFTHSDKRQLYLLERCSDKVYDGSYSFVKRLKKTHTLH